GDDYEGLLSDLGKDMINFIYSKLFDPDFDQNKPEGMLDQIIYRTDLIQEARQFLKSTTYNGLEILIDETINSEVLTFLQDKFNKGEKWTKLEKIIADVASFYMGVRDNLPTDDERAESIKKKFNENKQSYSTLEFIKDLMDELQRQPEVLAKIIPSRLYHFTQSDLSQFWKGKKAFLTSALYRKRHLNPNFEFSEINMNFLKTKSKERFEAKSLGLLEIIRQYNERELDVFEFADKFKNELGRISSQIKVTNNELSAYFGMYDGYISEVISKIENSDDANFDPTFKFSREVLRSLVGNLEVDKYSFRNILEIVKKYNSLNPDLKDYSKQQYTITNPHFFSDVIKNNDASYWFGFFSADGWVSQEEHRIGIELNRKDVKELKKFADLIGFDESRISPRTKFVNYRGEIRVYDSDFIAFVCRPMAQALKKEGIYGSKYERKSVPNFVEQAVDLAKEEAERVGIHWSETEYGRVAHAWLLGFYDGDGSYRGGYSAVIYSSSQDLLHNIKDLFEIENDVNTKVNPGDLEICFNTWQVSKGFWSLTLGPDVFRRILKSYTGSMQRKRPKINYEFGDFPFRLSEYYDPALIEELISQGIKVDETKLMAIVQNRESRIVWLEMGTERRGLTHILLGHSEGDKSFRKIFGISGDPQVIGNFIFNAIKKYPIHLTYPSRYPGSKFYVYQIRRKGDINYIHVLVDEEGSIVTAFPSMYEN
ncbi:MAG: hypothetical protein KGD74_11275, partial [Candidatus Lokiarchaeota archaeon]|nr:hypothetical protein [Candidatus Lokiarchaeota archaeon]